MVVCGIITGAGGGAEHLIPKHVGGAGGFVHARISVKPGSVLTVVCGDGGRSGNTASSSVRTLPAHLPICIHGSPYICTFQLRHEHISPSPPLSTLHNPLFESSSGHNLICLTALVALELARMAIVDARQLQRIWEAVVKTIPGMVVVGAVRSGTVVG